MKKKIIVIVSCVAVAAVAIGAYLFSNQGTASVGIPVLTTDLAKTTLQNTITGSGIVESVDSVNVYGKVATAFIDKINVKVGDQVTEGQILCELDTEDIDRQIAQQQTTINYTIQKAQMALESSERSYESMKDLLDADLYSALLQAESSVEQAKQNLDARQRSYDNMTSDKSDLHKDFLDAFTYWKETEKDCNDLRKEIRDLEKKLAAAQDPTEQESIKQDIEYTKQQLKEAESHYETSKKEYTDAKSLYQQDTTRMEEAEVALENAKTSLATAEKSLESTKKQVQTQLTELQKGIESSTLSANDPTLRFGLQNLQKQREDYVVKAPASGTVTAVFAKEGGAGGGLMFQIEDIQELQIKAYIKEFDYNSIKAGQSVTIKSDGTGDAVMNGSVVSIAPTAKKAADGSILSTGNTFETTIAVHKPHDGLVIGMNTRLNILLDSRDNVYAVPYDSVVFSPDGSTHIMAAVSDGKEGFVAKTIPVTTGMETDFYIEIMGDGITDGTMIINTPDTVAEGLPVIVRR